MSRTNSSSSRYFLGNLIKNKPPSTPPLIRQLESAAIPPNGNDVASVVVITDQQSNHIKPPPSPTPLQSPTMSPSPLPQGQHYQLPPRLMLRVSGDGDTEYFDNDVQQQPHLQRNRHQAPYHHHYRIDTGMANLLSHGEDGHHEDGNHDGSGSDGHNSHMGHTGHGGGSGQHEGNGGNNAPHHQMSMVFHTGSEETILFKFWRTKYVWHMVLSCFIVILLGIAYEAIKFYREWLYKQRAAERHKARQEAKAVSERNERNSRRIVELPLTSRRKPTVVAYSFNRRSLAGEQRPPQHSSATTSIRALRLDASPSRRSTTTSRTLVARRSPSKLIHQNGSKSSMFSTLHIVQTLLHVAQVSLAFLLMLIFMTFNIWLCLAVIFGAGFGYFLFFWRLQAANLDHCS